MQPEQRGTEDGAPIAVQDPPEQGREQQALGLKERDCGAHATVERPVPPFHISGPCEIWRAERLRPPYFSRMTARISCLLIAAWIPAAVAAPRAYAIEGNASSATAHVG